MSAPLPLTHVELMHVEGAVERWVRFGRHAAERIVDRRSRVLSFAPGAIFAFVRWRSGDHGTVESRIDILRAPRSGDAFSTVPFVSPGGISLLRLSGWPKVERVLQAVDQVESLGLDAADACPDHWRHVHNQLACAREPRPYTTERHRAWSLRAQVLS